MSDEHTPAPQYEPASPQSRLSSASLFKIIVPVIVIGFILLLVYTFLSGLRSAQKTVKISPTPSPTSSTTTTSQVNAPLTANETGMRSVKAGMQNETFFPYALNLSEGWGNTHESNVSAPSDTLSLTKDAYAISIVQDNTAGGFCLFPEDASDVVGQRYKTAVGIPGINAQFRRATNDNKTFVICEKKGNGYAYPTSFGQITYSVPVPTDPAILNEMDAMVASLNR